MASDLGLQAWYRSKLLMPVRFNIYCNFKPDPISRPWWLIWMRVGFVIRRLRIRPTAGRQLSFVEIDNEIFSTVIPSFPLIQEGQLSVSGERMCTILVNRLED